MQPPAPICKKQKHFTKSLWYIRLSISISGLLISLTVIFAAGLAVYENPQVRQWVDSSRRKIAIALHSLGDEITPPPASRDRSPDASTREDESTDAAERRRKVRQDILERARLMEEKRKTKMEENGKSKSFDNLVNRDGNLLDAKKAAKTTAAELDNPEPGLRQRIPETNSPALDIQTTTQAGGEMAADLPDSRPSTPTMAASPSPSTPTPNTQPALLIDTETISNHPSEALIDITPTTSTSSAAEPEFFSFSQHSSQLPHQNHQSVHEWAENNTGPVFYSSLQTGQAVLDNQEPWRSSTPVNDDHFSVAETDAWSEIEDGLTTPGSWTEAGSVTSEDY